MKTTITLAPATIRARVKALSALHSLYDNSESELLSDDNDPALNQGIVFAFFKAVMHLSSHIESFSVSPDDFNDGPYEALLLEVTFNTPDNAAIFRPLIKTSLEDFISNRLLAESLPSCHLTTLFRTRETEALATLSQIFDNTTTPSSLRRQRTI